MIVAGEPIEIADENCMLFTFADLDPRKKAETALRQSEERFAKSFRLSPVPAAIYKLDGFKLLEVNEAFKTMAGFSEEEIVGRSAAELDLWSDKTAQRQFEQTIEKTGSVRDLDLQLRAKDGALVDCLVSADTVTIHDERCVLCVMQDITDRKRSQDELVAAIEAVMADTSWFSRSVVEKLAALRQTSRPSALRADLQDLTDRERDVLGLICQGQTDLDMSESLKLSHNTIRNHLASLYRKIGVNRRASRHHLGPRARHHRQECDQARKAGAKISCQVTNTSHIACHFCVLYWHVIPALLETCTYASKNADR